MSDPVTLGLASTAVGLVNSTIGLLKQAREAAKSSDDHELKDSLSELFDEVLKLKETIQYLAQENSDLRQKLAQQSSVKRESQSGLYFQEGDPDPFCPICWEFEGMLIHLDALRPQVVKGQGWPQMARLCMKCRNYQLKS